MVIIAIIPCYNEARSAGDIITRASQYVDRVIVPDDNSTDDTVLVATKAEATIAMNHTNKRGAGANTKRGIDMAKALNPEIIVTLDGDGQHNPDEIPRVVKPIMDNKANLVIGSRFMPGHYDNTAPLYRRVGIGIITLLYNMFSSQKVYDAQSCFRAYSKELLAKNIMTEYGFAFSVETLVKARAYGFKIKEIPISCIYHKEHSQNSTLNPVKHGFGVALAVIKWRTKIEIPILFKQIAFTLLMRATKPLMGKGLGHLHFLGYIYSKLTKLIMPERDKIIQVENFMMKVNTDRRGLDGMTTIVVASHTYEPMTTKVFKLLLKEGMNVVDIGANIGYFTLLASKLVGDKGKVWAIEPEPYNLQCLLDNVVLNNMTNIVAIEKAASDVNGKAVLYVSRRECGEHSLLTGRSYIKDTIEVETMKLDDLIDNQRVDFIKTDTEGNEVAVLHGARRILKYNKDLVLITEVYLPGLKVSGYSPQDFFGMLEQRFKFIYIIDEIRKEIIPGTCQEAVKRCQGGKFSVNLLCSMKHIEIKIFGRNI